MRHPFPLQWPETWSRTLPDHRESSRFRTGLKQALDGLMAELGRLGAENVVVTSNLPTKGSGLPYASGRADDPGIAVWFVLDGAERVFACDRYVQPADNVRAIAATVQALRGIARWGASDMVTRAFQGFNALPPAPTEERPWWEVLGVPRDATLEMATRAFRVLSRKHHPDAGGDMAMQVRLNHAMTAARVAMASSRVTAFSIGREDENQMCYAIEDAGYTVEDATSIGPASTNLCTSMPADQLVKLARSLRIRIFDVNNLA